jgi:hypothetical protein
VHRGHADAGAVRLGHPLTPELVGGHLLVIGGAGFIGSAYVRNPLRRGDGTRVTVLDKLTITGNRSNLEPAGAWDACYDRQYARRLAAPRKA